MGVDAQVSENFQHGGSMTIFLLIFFFTSLIADGPQRLGGVIGCKYKTLHRI